MAHINLLGMGVALVTPFHSDKTIDYPALSRIIEHIVCNGTDFLVVMGTTGETPTLSYDERESIRDFVRVKVNGRIPLVLGIGGYNTAEIVKLVSTQNLTGYSAILSVVPPYSKPSQEGIFRHFEAIAKASPLPIILYNVPGRTGVNMTAETTLRIAREVPNVIGIKEASGNFDQIETIIKEKPAGFAVISGDDGKTYPLMTLGAEGVISVLGNAFPREFSEMVHLCLEGNYIEAVDIHYKFREISRLLFADGNPAGVKCVMHDMGLLQNELRLPLVPVCKHTADEILKWVNILKS